MRGAALLFVAAGAAAAAYSSGPLPPARLRCDGSDAAGRRASHTDYAVASLTPLFQWAPRHTENGAVHRAFHIKVTDAATGAEVWDSGVTASKEPSLRYPASAPALSPGRGYEWAVSWRDGDGAASGWSSAAFRTPLDAVQWDGVEWIGSATENLYRAEFDVPANAKATLYICGLGYSRVEINGQAYGAELTTAPWYNNERQNGYSSLDISSLLDKSGTAQAVGVALGNGWRSLHRKEDASGDGVTRVLRAQLALTYANGSTEYVLKTGASAWTAAAGPVTADNIYNGETYDARMFQAGWSAPNFKPAKPWAAATVVKDGPRGGMVPWSAPMVQVSKVVPPVRVWRNGGGTCGEVAEKADLSLGCPAGEAIDQVTFASFGAPTGSCDAGFSANASCDAAKAADVVRAACVGKNGCTVRADCTDAKAASCTAFGGDPCFGVTKKLAASVHCAKSPNATGGSGTWTVDFGSNTAGVCRLVGVKGAAGAQVTLRHAEILQHAGIPGGGADTTKIYTGNLRSAQATDKYIMSGQAGGESWQPTMTYHGFRYVEVSGLDAFSAANIEKHHFHSAVPQRAHATFSSPTLTRLQAMALGAQRSNMMTVPTDCDQRDERLGWMGDSDLSVDSIALNYDAAAFLQDWMGNMASEQNADGSLPDVVPFVRYGGRPADASWSTAFIQVAYMLWKTYGDTATPAAHFDGLVRQIDNLMGQAKNGLRNMPQPYGDWCPPPAKQGGGQGAKPSKAYTPNFAYIGSVAQVAEMAAALGNTTEADRLTALHAQLKTEFNAAWYHNDTATYDTGSQTALTLALQLGTPPDAKRTSDALLAAVTATGHHFYTGIIGFKYLFDQLDAAGHAKDAVAVLEQTDYPSIGYEFANTLEPATENLWELPDAPKEGTGMNSRNHHMYSSFSHYLVAHVAGVAQQPGSAAHRRLLLRPAAGGALDVSAASVTLDTARGTVVHAWRREGGAQCGKAAHGDTVRIDCGAGGGEVAEVRFASFGAPTGGACRSGSFAAAPGCHAAASADVVRRLCVGRRECAVAASPEVFGLNDTGACDGLRLWVDVQCSRPQALHVHAEVPVSAEAELHLPAEGLGIGDAVVARGADVVFRGGRALGAAPVREAADGTAAARRVIVAALGSGAHDFTLSAAQ